jgi:hypothetical protein
LPRYRLSVEDPQADQALTSFWRLFSTIRLYRQLGTAQAEAAYSTLFIGWSIGMSWRDALDTALSDTLADQLQVLARDEQRVLLAFIEHANEPERFTERVNAILALLPNSRQVAHLSHLRLADPVPGADSIDDTGGGLTAAQLGRLFDLGDQLTIDSSGVFARRLMAFVNERGL